MKMLSVADVSRDVLPWSYVVKTPSQGPKDGWFVPSLPKRSSTKFTTSSGVLLSNKTRGWFQQPNGGNESISQREKGQSSTQKCRIGYVPRRLFEGEEIPCFKTVPWMHFKEKPLTPTPVLCFYLYSKSTHKKKNQLNNKKKTHMSHVYQRSPPIFFLRTIIFTFSPFSPRLVRGQLCEATQIGLSNGGMVVGMALSETGTLRGGYCFAECWTRLATRTPFWDWVTPI